ncbi:MAG: TolC family protein [Bacteroidaceae bacterium]|nr:TolC family protein [Prevotella sp.]MBQ6751333.1 TolC family protein [Bacteroidaceae bacterium]
MKKNIAFLLSWICCGTIAAQTTLTLDQCKQLARDNNITLRSAKNDIQQAEQQRKQTFTNFFPQVSAMGAGMTANKHLMQMDMALPAPLTAAMPAGAATPMSMGMIKNGVVGNVMAMQPIFAGGQIVNGNKLAKVGLEASRIQLEASEDEVELTTEQYYWQVVSLKEKLVTLASLHKMLEQLEKDVTVSVNAGVTTRNDLLQVQLKVNEIESQTLLVENGLAISKQLLAQYIGKNGETLDVSEPVPYSTTFSLPQRQDHVAALAATPQYRLLEKNVESNRLQHKIKIGENLPTVSGGAVYTYNNLMGEGRGVGMLMATVSIPISGWWSGSHAIKKQRLAYEQARDQMADASQKLVINMNNCWANVETSHKQLAIARKSIEQSEENLRLNNDYYRAGTTTMSNLLDAQSSYQQSRDKYVDAYIDYQQNLLKYRQATGQ